MTARREIERHLKALDDIRSIMSSMKTLALLETHKLARRLAAQNRVVASIEAAADDFRGFFPFTPSLPRDSRSVHLLFGSERGFCGDFNEALLKALPASETVQPPLVLAVGRKLCARLAGDERVIVRLDGANVAEEVEAVLNRLVDTLAALQQQHGAFALTAVYHRADEGGVGTVHVLPPFQDPAPVPRYSFPPRLTLAPEAFFAALLDHYLFAALHALAYTSLMAENHRRLEHLEGAVRRLEQDSAELSRRRNVLRQEEITEEIEVIMLSAESALRVRS